MNSMIKLSDVYYKNKNKFSHKWWMGALKMIKTYKNDAKLGKNPDPIDWDEYIKKGEIEMIKIIDKKPLKENNGYMVYVDNSVIDMVFVEDGLSDAWAVGEGVFAEIEIPSLVKESIEMVKKWYGI